MDPGREEESLHLRSDSTRLAASSDRLGKKNANKKEKLKASNREAAASTLRAFFSAWQDETQGG